MKDETANAAQILRNPLFLTGLGALPFVLGSAASVLLAKGANPSPFSIYLLISGFIWVFARDLCFRSKKLAPRWWIKRRALVTLVIGLALATLVSTRDFT